MSGSAVRARFLVAAVGCGAILVAAQAVYSFAPPTAVKRARPPKFDKAVTDAFYPDAREKLGGPRPQKSAATAAPLASATPPSAAPAGTTEKGRTCRGRA